MLPMGCFFTTLSMVDSMMLGGVTPAILGIGFIATSVFYTSQQLGMPLWLSRKIFRYITVTFMGLIFVGYVSMERDQQMNEKVRTMHNI